MASRLRSIKDHPRIRGEHLSCARRSSCGVGSSPHTRGAPAVAEASSRPARIIPAYAGSTSPTQPRSPTHTDHPRIRGEHSTPMPGTRRPSGSSPHTRGALPPAPQRRKSCRIIPAYAGSTYAASRSCSRRRDHPRIRGEHAFLEAYCLTPRGSSPHTRGARRLGAPLRGPQRIIPAYAGSTAPFGSPSNPDPDHPRIRGEHPIAAKPDNLVMGSSPHTRGAPSSLHTFVPHSGIIPAYAGSTGSLANSAGSSWDHPRIRGEHQRPQVLYEALCGSSPHTRGAQGLAGAGPVERRIIPAYAGSTLP